MPCLWLVSFHCELAFVPVAVAYLFLVRSMRRVALIVIVTLASLVCQPAHADISQDHAQQLAQTYFVRYFHIGCGGVGVPTLRGDRWEAPLRLGVAGTFSGYVYVDSRTGDVSSRGHPVASAASLEAYSAELKRRARESKSKKHAGT